MKHHDFSYLEKLIHSHNFVPIWTTYNHVAAIPSYSPPQGCEWRQYLFRADIFDGGDGERNSVFLTLSHSSWGEINRQRKILADKVSESKLIVKMITKYTRTAMKDSLELKNPLLLSEQFQHLLIRANTALSDAKKLKVDCEGYVVFR